MYIIIIIIIIIISSSSSSSGSSSSILFVGAACSVHCYKISNSALKCGENSVSLE